MGRRDRLPDPHRADVQRRPAGVHLLSDVLGVSMLVETINHRTGGTSTESTVLGPFHMVQSPPRKLGDDINLDDKGTPCLVSGQVRRRAARRRRRRRVAEQRGRLLRRPAARHPAAGKPARIVQRGRRRAVLVPVGRAALLPDPRRRAGRAVARGDRPAPQPAGTPPLHHLCIRLPAGDHARVRRRLPLPGLRRGVRRQGEPGPGRARDRRPRSRGRGRPGQPNPSGCRTSCRWCTDPWPSGVC